MHHIISSRVLCYPSVVWTIVSHVPVLDFFVVLRNSILVLCVSDAGEVLSFVSVKKHGSSHELGTVYTYPQHRSKGYASELIAYVLQRYQPIWLLCKRQMLPYYEKFGFQENNHELWMIKLRRKLFNIFLQPIWGYPLVSMVYKNTKI